MRFCLIVHNRPNLPKRSRAGGAAGHLGLLAGAIIAGRGASTNVADIGAGHVRGGHKRDCPCKRGLQGCCGRIGGRAGA